ncbi:hypothetical protein, partial [Sphingobium fuliginis]|uniref:hypothetical protein n=1 Tax=Sphingobium fuliginis (strain ATCC 27551) TaxID=336203 RepID=UPI0020C823C7
KKGSVFIVCRGRVCCSVPDVGDRRICVGFAAARLRALTGGNEPCIGILPCSTSDTLVDGNGHDVADSNLDTNVILLRYVKYFDLAGMRADVNVLQSFGGLNNMRIAGTDIDTKHFSSGDLTLVGTIWPLNDPKNGRYLALPPISPYRPATILPASLAWGLIDGLSPFSQASCSISPPNGRSILGET